MAANQTKLIAGDCSVFFHREFYDGAPVLREAYEGFGDMQVASDLRLTKPTLFFGAVFGNLGSKGCHVGGVERGFDVIDGRLSYLAGFVESPREEAGSDERKTHGESSRTSLLFSGNGGPELGVRIVGL